MTNKLERNASRRLDVEWPNGVSGVVPSLRRGASGGIRVHAPVRLCLSSGAVVERGYSTVEHDPHGWTAKSVMDADDGTRLEVIDRWTRTDGDSLAVRRNATVLEAGTSDGLRLEFRATAFGADAFEDWELFVPGALYNRNDTDGDGREDYLGTYVQEYRDDRLPSLGVLGYLPSAGAAVSISRSTVPATDAAITDAQLLSRRVVQDTDIGSLGLAPAGDDLQLRAAYPFAEEHSFCLNTAGDGWAGHLPNERGRTFTVSYELRLRPAESLTDAIWDLVQHQMATLGTARPDVPFAIEDALKERLGLTERYYTEWDPAPGGGRPAGYAVHFSPRTGETLGALLEYGFSGAQTLLAYTGIEDGHRSGRPDRVEHGRNVIEFFVQRAQCPNGFSHGIYDADRDAFIHWFTGILTPFQYAEDADDARRYLGTQMTEALLPVARDLRAIEGNYTRTMCESIYPILLAYRAEAARGQEQRSWLEAGRRFGEFLLRTQGADGSWHRAYDPDGAAIVFPASWFGATDIERKSGTIFPVEVLLTLAELTGEQRWVDAAVRAGEFILNAFVRPVNYIGGLNDTTHIKSVKGDAVGAMFVMRSLIKLHAHTHEERFLIGARDAARALASWVFIWDVPFCSDSLLGGSSFRSTGWAACDVIAAGGYVDDEFLEFVGDLVKVAQATGDQALFDVADIVQHGMQGALSMPDRMLGYAHAGIQCEGLLTSYWLSDPDTTDFSGAVSKRKGDDNDTCNGLINGQAAYGAFDLLATYGTLDFNRLRDSIFADRSRSLLTEFNNAR